MAFISFIGDIQLAALMVEWEWNFRYSEKENCGNVYSNQHSNPR